MSTKVSRPVLRGPGPSNGAWLLGDPKMTVNFLIWVGGVFMLALFLLLAHFVWRIL
jgi:hypothetical protein